MVVPNTPFIKEAEESDPNSLANSTASSIITF
ncbi:MAG: hypothetical protein US90_C0011G0003 [Candidatus Shapirobacteria bacterium GW2011_GWE2_38_30]|uniref:Uncharacterized protein n=1 Tax=Candidatus Shapirobacteria bacterium GW2011_GWE2_38_30 TaxID=1618490 RepID=A0A0G0K2V0_9BACT|nr:MAG: hypothetical protein US90_C0011G0003 [Candidatus Shapirobacteria bacterium GW2011_GWE2_38_30]